MITIVILAIIAIAVTAGSIISVRNDGYGRVPDRMSTSRLREQHVREAEQDIELRARTSVSHTVATARLV